MTQFNPHNASVSPIQPEVLGCRLVEDEDKDDKYLDDNLANLSIHKTPDTPGRAAKSLKAKVVKTAE